MWEFLLLLIANLHYEWTVFKQLITYLPCGAMLLWFKNLNMSCAVPVSYHLVLTVDYIWLRFILWKSSVA